MPRPSTLDPDLRPATAARRRFRGWSGRRAQLPPLAPPAATARRVRLADGTDVARTRREVDDRLVRWGLAPTDVATVRLVVSELVSYALAHEHAVRVAIALVDAGGHVTVEVGYRRAPGRHPAGAPSPVAPATIGLTVVGRLATRWAHVDTGHGGRFRAVVATPRTAVPSRRT